MIIPGFIAMFFSNATIGIYANNYGGWRAVMRICFVMGLIEIFGSAWAVHLFQAGNGVSLEGWMGCTDWTTLIPAAMQGLAMGKWFLGIILLAAIIYMFRAGKAL